MAEIFLDITSEEFQALSATEKFLLDYIKAHLKNVSSMPITKLSENANVSTATIVRFAQKIGFDGFSSFKCHLKKQVSNSTHTDRLEDIDKDISQVIKKNELEVINTISLLNIEIIEKAIQTIYHAEKIYIFARGFSEFIASSLNIKLQLLRKNTELHTDPNIIKTISRRLKQNEIVIFISLNGETPELVEACKNCQINQINTIAITTNIESPLSYFSTFTLHGFKSSISLLPEYEVSSRLPLEVISRILLDAYIIRTQI